MKTRKQPVHPSWAQVVVAEYRRKHVDYRDHVELVWTDLMGEIEMYGHRPPTPWWRARVARMQAHWEVWMRTVIRPLICKMCGHDWQHEESESAEVGFWCESWCDRCGYSTGRKWM